MYDKFAVPSRTREVESFDDYMTKRGISQDRIFLAEFGSSDWGAIESYAPIAAQEAGFCFIVLDKSGTDYYEIWASTDSGTIPWNDDWIYVAYSATKLHASIKRQSKRQHKA